MENEKISVVMTAYNGEKYIRKQIESVLINLDENDEYIIIDDGSTDETINIIEKYMNNNHRIKLYKRNHCGQGKNTEYGILKATNNIIFCCDQDDIWVKDKKKIALSKMNDGIDLLQHNASLIDDEDKAFPESLYDRFPATNKFWSNYYKSKVFGCCLVVRKEFAMRTFPIPDKLCHDIWFALLCPKNKYLIIDEKLINYRRHSNNQSSFYQRSSMAHIIKNRIYLLFKIIIKKIRRVK